MFVQWVYKLCHRYFVKVCHCVHACILVKHAVGVGSLVPDYIPGKVDETVI